VSADIYLNGRRATVEHGVWSVEGDDAAARAWTRLLGDMTPPAGVSPTVGRPDVWLARRAVDWLGRAGQRAALVYVSAEQYEPGRVY
jgi:hypothetical protein